MEEKYFDHEKLKVHQLALEFNKYAHKICVKLDSRSDIKNQLDRASNSIVLNIAEGNGKHSKKDKGRYFDISIGSLFECAGCLDILMARNILMNEELKTG